MSGTCDSLDAHGDSFGMLAVEITGGGAPRRPVCLAAGSAWCGSRSTWASLSAMR